MPDLQTCTTDELVAEMERRLEQGTVGYHGLYSTNQMAWREAWTDVMDLLNDLCNGDYERWQPHRQMMWNAQARHAGDQVQERRQVYAVNTTLPGREHELQ